MTTNCRICWNDVPDELMVTLGCTHVMCGVCLVKLVSSGIADGGSLPSRCYRCMAEINPHLIPNDSVRENYLQTLSVFNKRRNPNLRPCLVPNCEGFRARVGDSECDLCGERYCGSCGSSGTGSHYHLRRRRPQQPPVVIPVQTKNCIGCGISVEKIHGCNHMVCSRCRSEFCFVCGRDLSSHEDDQWCV